MVVSLPFMFYTGATGSLHIAVADFIFVVLAIASLHQPMTERQTVALRPLLMFALIVMTVVVNSAFVASIVDPAFSMTLAVMNAFKVVVVLAYAAVFALYASRTEENAVGSLFRTWAWTATAVSWATIATAADLVDVVPHDGVRSSGFMQDPNLYGGYLVVSISAVVAAEVMRRSHWSLVQLISLVAGIVLTASRGALGSLALVVVVAVLLVASWSFRVLLVGVGCLAVVLLYTVGSGPVGRWLHPSVERLNATSGRLLGEDPRWRLWARALSVWNDHPLFGVGIGQFGRFTIDVNGLDDNDVGQIAHNTFLSFLVETGVFGLVLCVAGLVFTAVRLYRDRRLSLRLRHSLALGLLAISTEMFTLNFQNVRYVWVFIGLVWGMTAWRSEVSRS